jgi:hypothetical protein
MGEIKSTLDLIMERTKNLTASEEEKRAFRKKELAGKVKALVQRTLDGLITGERLREELLQLQEESGNEPLLKRVLFEEAIGRIELGSKHDFYLSLLERFIGVDPEPLRAVLRRFAAAADQMKDRHEDVLRKRLEERGISGSAVMANLEAAPDWKEAVHNLHDALRAELKKAQG